VALALAAEGSKARRGTVEVRPFRTEEQRFLGSMAAAAPVRAMLEP
jgi:hypothetical protein